MCRRRHKADTTPLQRTDVGALVQSLIDDLAEQGEHVGGEVASEVESTEVATAVCVPK